MKNIGVRFHDGTEVAYYGSNKIEKRSDEFLLVTRIDDPDGATVVLAEVRHADVKEVFEVELAEATA